MDLDPEEEGSKWQHKMVADHVIARMLKRKVVVAQIARLKNKNDNAKQQVNLGHRKKMFLANFHLHLTA